MKVTILMPCLNESLTIGKCIEKAIKWGKSSNREFEVVIADNGSTDGSQKIAEGLGARVIDVPTKGYGAALNAGCKAAHGDLIIMGDSDDSYDFSALDQFVEQAESGHDLVMGNRFRGGIEPGAMPWKNRYIGNPALSLIGKILFKSHINDFHCGLRAITKSAYDRLGLVTTGMEFASEMVIKAHISGMRIVEVPTTLSVDGRDRPPHLRPWRDGWRHLKFMLLMSPKWLFFKPAIFLVLVGLVGMWKTYYGPYYLFGLGLDTGAFVLFNMSFVGGLMVALFGLTVQVVGVRDQVFKGNVVRMFKEKSFLEYGSVIGLVMLLISCFVISTSVLQWLPDGNVERAAMNVKNLVLAGTLGLTGIILIFFSFLIGYICSPISTKFTNEKM